MPNSENPSAKTTTPVLRLQTPSQPVIRTGRKPNLKMPPLPEELLEGYSALERAHFEFFLESYKRDYGISKPSDYIALYMAACEYINLLRVQALSARTGEVITAARQHPGVQLRAWLDSMGGTRKQRRQEGEKDAEKDQWTEAMKKLSS